MSLQPKPIIPPIGEKVRVILVRGDEVVYDSSKDEAKPAFIADRELLKFCPKCGGDTAPIIYLCNKCGMRFISQVEVVSGRKLILTLEPEETKNM